MQLTICLIYVTSGVLTVRVENQSFANFTYCKIFNNGIATGYCIWVFNNSAVGTPGGTVLDCGTPNTNNALLVQLNSTANCTSSTASGYCRIRNAANGCYASSGGQIGNTANVQYSGNSADETVDAPSFGYID
jgi:hypothetical protein